jgi:hypothetical protein
MLMQLGPHCWLKRGADIKCLAYIYLTRYTHQIYLQRS